MMEAQANLAAFSKKTVFKRMMTVNAAAEVEDESLDFIYVDARHDECGVAEDLALWWPKLRKGALQSVDQLCYVDSFNSFWI